MGVRRVILAAINPLVGPVNLVLLEVPEEFRVMPMGEEPEVNSIVRINNVAWVRDGRARYLFTDGTRGAILEVVIDERKVKGYGESVEMMNGHRGFISKGEKKSFFSGKVEQYSTLEFYCDVTKRRVSLTMKGKYSHEFIHLVYNVICH